MIEVIGKNGISAKIVLDSKSAVTGDRLTTMEITYPRFILAEFNTHRCLASDTILYFDLPSGTKNTDKRIHTMTIGEFCKKWNKGVKEHEVGSMVKYDLSDIQKDILYTARELAEITGANVSGIRTDCRKERCSVQNPTKLRSEDFIIKGEDFIQYRENHGKRTFDIKKRLSEMKIRMYNEETNQLEHTTVTDCWEVGTKKVYQLTAGAFKIKATEDHLILTNNGWKELQDIGLNDCVLTQGRAKADYEDSSRFKKINGKWVSKWNKEIMPILLERQQNVCFDCGIEGKLEVHHVVPVSEDTSKAFEIDNVVALHQKCHKKRHNIQGWQRGCNLTVVETRVTSIDYVGEELVYDLSVKSEFHNFIANGIVVHNCFSRNSASSRAIPFAKMQENLTAIPVRFGQANKGMQDKGEEYNKPVIFHNYYAECLVQGSPEATWETAKCHAEELSRALYDAGYHKQVYNRLTEPFQMMKTVVSATEWDNFFWLRDDDAADPSIAELARCMKQAYEQSKPQVLQAGEYHLPYVKCVYDDMRKEQNFEIENEFEYSEIISLEDAIKVSCARACAVSFRNTDYGLEKSREVYERLISDSKIHGSALEHAAKVIERPYFGKNINREMINISALSNTWEKGISHVDRDGKLWSGNYCGFIQHRKTIAGENYKT